jgi:hypothetical protein
MPVGNRFTHRHDGELRRSELQADPGGLKEEA